MVMSLGIAKRKFSSIIEELKANQFVLSQFAIWLDIRLAEYKLQGFMALDCNNFMTAPDWLQGAKNGENKPTNVSSEKMPDDDSDDHSDTKSVGESGGAGYAAAIENEEHPSKKIKLEQSESDQETHITAPAHIDTSCHFPLPSFQYFPNIDATTSAGSNMEYTCASQQNKSLEDTLKSLIALQSQVTQAYPDPNITAAYQKMISRMNPLLDVHSDLSYAKGSSVWGAKLDSNGGNEELTSELAREQSSSTYQDGQSASFCYNSETQNESTIPFSQKNSVAISHEHSLSTSDGNVSPKAITSSLDNSVVQSNSQAMHLDNECNVNVGYSENAATGALAQSTEGCDPLDAIAFSNSLYSQIRDEISRTCKNVSETGIFVKKPVSRVNYKLPKWSQINTEEAVSTFEMTELVQNSGVFIHVNQYDEAVGKTRTLQQGWSKKSCPDGAGMARFLMSCFWSTSDLVNSSMVKSPKANVKPGDRALEPKIIESIEAFCLTHTKDNRSRIRQALLSKVTAAKSKARKRLLPAPVLTADVVDPAPVLTADVANT